MTVLVKISISATGALTDARVEQTSGYELFDSAAVAAARASTYAPMMVNCTATPMDAIAREDFSPTRGKPRSPDPFHSPRFTLDAGWVPNNRIYVLDSAMRRVLNTWQRGNEQLSIAGYATSETDLTLADAVASEKQALDAPAAAAAAPHDVTLCNGTQTAQELLFDFQPYKSDARSASAFVTVTKGVIYSIVYTAPKGASISPDTFAALRTVCV